MNKYFQKIGEQAESITSHIARNSPNLALDRKDQNDLEVCLDGWSSRTMTWVTLALSTNKYI